MREKGERVTANRVLLRLTQFTKEGRANHISILYPLFSPGRGEEKKKGLLAFQASPLC